MEDLVLVLWVIGWPFVVSLGKYVDLKSKREYTQSTVDLTALLNAAIWIGMWIHLTK